MARPGAPGYDEGPGGELPPVLARKGPPGPVLLYVVGAAVAAA